MGTRLFVAFANCALLCVLLRRDAVQAAPTDASSYVNVTADCPRIISREEWGARKSKGHEFLEVTPTPYVVIHHGGIPNYCHTQEECSALVRHYQDLHLDDRDWFDIGYNFVIGEDGNAYQGRGWNYVGAHAPGYNTQSIGICIIGDFTKFIPNNAALDTLNSLIACGVSLGKIDKSYKAIGHRQTRVTECPGEAFYQYVKKMSHWTAHPVPIYHQTTITSAPTINENAVDTYDDGRGDIHQ